MEIVYHLGVHLTDEERVPRTLLKNRAVLARERIVVPWPRQYRYIFRDLMNRLGGKKANREMQDLILDGLTTMDDPKRVVFCNENFFCLRPQALGPDQFYPMAGERARRLRYIFPENEVSFFLAVRNPATFVPALYEAVQPSEYESFIGATDPARLAWSEMIARIRESVPDSRITVWCNEDLPVLWPEVLRAVTGHGPDTRLSNLGEFWGQLMVPEGLKRMQSYFADHPPASDERRRRAVAAFLEKFGRPDKIEMEIDLPGWTEEVVEAMTLAYEADLAAIARTPSVTLLT
jgi:hypothetical protein